MQRFIKRHTRVDGLGGDPLDALYWNDVQATAPETPFDHQVRHNTRVLDQHGAEQATQPDIVRRDSLSPPKFQFSSPSRTADTDVGL